ncbi:hypothetical protein MIR68_001775 [Amoeboaphelidium protococcarum]|nr:hypothetical protein MIR68_001775 [Amoeboaphelidium protococcarum]
MLSGDQRANLSSTSTQFARVEYLLQRSLGASTAKITSATVISNPHQLLQFEKQAQNKTVLESFVDVQQVSGSHSDDELIKRLSSPEFKLASAAGMKFPVGKIKLDNAQTKNSASTKIVKKMVVFKVVVGRSQIADPANVMKDDIPDGYDSFLINHDAASPTNFHYDYWIKNASQVLPEYIITFEFDPIAEKNSREKPICDNCEKAFATVHCAADVANLCQDCDTNLHNANKLAQRHIRTPIGQGADVFGRCRHHPEKVIEFFCSQCHVPVCVHCKMVGNHSSGEASKHKLVAVSEAFDQVLKESKIKDQVLANKKKGISKKVELIHERAQQVELQHKELEAQLHDIYKSALGKLRNEVNKKLLTLSGDECELKRQECEIDQLESFLEYIRTGVDACHLLNSWSRHQMSRQEMHHLKNFREYIDVFCDLKVVGALSVMCDESIKSEVAQSYSNKPGRMRSQQVKQVSRSTAQDAASSRGGLAVSTAGTVSGNRVSKRTSDFFAETLNALEDMGLERSSYVNNYNDDEKSIITTAGYEKY